MFKNILQKAGLTPTQAMILEHLFEAKEAKASDIAQKISKSRAIVYKDLDELCALKVVERSERPGQVAVFRLGHPSNMENYFEQEEKRLKKDRELFNNYLPDMVSAYNLMSNKPGVRFYEGEEGLKKILDDTLTSKTEICLLLNKEALEEEDAFRGLNARYKTKREKLGIKKKIIRVGKRPYGYEDESRDYEKITEIKYFEEENQTFKSSVQIYDGKVSFQIISKDSIMAILIENQHIYELNKLLFDSLWKHSA